MRSLFWQVYVLVAGVAIAQPRLELSQKSFCEYGAGSQRPALRVLLNLVEAERPVRVEVLDPRLRITAYEGSNEVPVIRESETAPERFAVLLVDSSGSMLEETAGGGSKFDATLAASRAFADTFVDGVDHVAVIPFGSHAVEASIRKAAFYDTKALLLAAIGALSPPDRRANTGLYTAAATALSRLQTLKRGASLRQFLLVILTDGRNEVLRGDDQGLLKDIAPVLSLAKEASIQVVTVGLGNAANLDENALKSLAWPDAANYRRAGDNSSLTDVFRRARALQLERFSLTILFREEIREALRGPRDFSLRLEIPDRPVIEGSFRWEPGSALTAPPFECVLNPAETSITTDRAWLRWYVAVLMAGAALHWYLWQVLPASLRKPREDTERLLNRAVCSIKKNRG